MSLRSYFSKEALTMAARRVFIPAPSQRPFSSADAQNATPARKTITSSTASPSLHISHARLHMDAIYERGAVQLLSPSSSRGLQDEPFGDCDDDNASDSSIEVGPLMPRTGTVPIRKVPLPLRNKQSSGAHNDGRSTSSDVAHQARLGNENSIPTTSKLQNPFGPAYEGEGFDAGGASMLVDPLGESLDGLRIKSPVNDHLSTADHKPQKEESCDKTSKDLKLYSYKDSEPKCTVVYTRSVDEVDDLVGCLRGKYLGFDLEWKVIFTQGRRQERRTALVQIADIASGIILLVHTSAMDRFPGKLKDLLEDKDTIKLGANIYNDGVKLYRDFGIKCSGLVELGAFASEVDPEFPWYYSRPRAGKGSTSKQGAADNIPITTSGKRRTIIALDKVVERYARKFLSKDNSVRMGNWEMVPLTERMKEYAANDAHCAATVYERLLTLANEQGISTTGATFAKSVTGGSNAIPPQPVSSTSANASTSTVGDSAEYELTASDIQDLNAVTVATSSIVQRPQHIRAYRLWHVQKKSLDVMCNTLKTGGRIEPLKRGTVITYIIEALKTDSSLNFDMQDLINLVMMDPSSWTRHRAWIESRQ